MRSGQPRVEQGHSPEENQVSRTSSSWRSSVPRHFGQVAGASRATSSLRKGSTRPGCGGPTRAAADAPVLDSLSQWKYVFVHCSGRITVFPSRTAAIAGSASGFMFNHWRRDHRLDDGLAALAAADGVQVFLRPAEQSQLGEPALDRLAGLLAVHPGEGAADVGDLSVLAEHRRNGRALRLPHSKSFGSCAGVTDGAGAELHVHGIESPTTGKVRSTIGCRTGRPITVW